MNYPLRILFILIIILGIFFRFSNLDAKVLTGDETVTLLRTSGHTFQEWKELASSTNNLTVETLFEYQYPNLNKNAWDTIIGLAKEEPQHPPFYFLLVRYWLKFWGNSVWIARSLSVIVSLAMLPAIYYLSQELFRNKLSSWIAVSLTAVSPFQILYGQDARSYSLWGLTILLSSCLLLRAIRINHWNAWVLYTISLVLSFYTFSLSLLIALGHGVYVLFCQASKHRKVLKRYVISTGISSALYLPWIMLITQNIANANQTTSWTSQKVPITRLVKTWLLNLSRSFIDINYNFVHRNFMMYIIILGLLLGIIYGIYYLIKHTSKDVWLFVVTLMGVTAIILVMADLALEGKRSSVIRYFMPSFLGINLCVSYILSAKITASFSSLERQLVKGVFALLISFGIFSGTLIIQTESWWNKYLHIFDSEVSEVINRSPNSAVITDWKTLMQLKHQVNSQVKIVPLERLIAIEEPQKNPFNDTQNAIQIDSDVVFIYSIYKNQKTVDLFLKHFPQYKLERAHEWDGWVEPVFYSETVLWQLNRAYHQLSQMTVAAR